MARNEILDSQVHTVVRRSLWAAAIGALVIGVLSLLFPKAALTTVALFFGIYLIVAGISRVSAAGTAKGAPGLWRILVAVVGVLVIVAGVLCLLNPFQGLLAVELFVGIGWMLDGIVSVVMAFALFARGSRMALLISGAVSFVLGLLVILVPGSALFSFLLLAAIFLVVIGVVTIVGLAISGARRREKASGAAA